MATTIPEIRVFAMFPLGADHPEPFSSWIWTHCLTFPLHILNELKIPKLYKWIRYATGVVVGAHGDLSFSLDSPENVLEYNHDVPFQSANLYYHISDDEKRKMFPIDPDPGRTTVTSSNTTSRRRHFRSDIAARDGTCVLTGFGDFECQAVHLLPHSKGDQYIEAFTQHRSRDTAGSDLVREINDVRNGVLLNRISHPNLGVHIAFLTTPNFAMSTADVDPTAPSTERRCTAHLFTPENPEKFGNPALRSGSRVRIPATANKWPPDILFDAVYAHAVLYHFAPSTMRDMLKQWETTFYPGGIASSTQVSDQVILDEQATKTERKNEQDQECEQHAAKGPGNEIDYYDCLLMLPYLMVPPDKREEVWRRTREEKAERERNCLEDNIVGWARDVANA